VLREEQCFHNAVQAGAGLKGWGFRVWGQMARLRAGCLEFALQIIRGNFDVPHGHAWIGMAE